MLKETIIYADFTMYRSPLRITRLTRFQSTFPYKKWSGLSIREKQTFVTEFVENYRVQYPGSKTNVSLKGLSLDMEKFNDAPSVFGIFYNDIWQLLKKSKDALYLNDTKKPIIRNDIKETGRFSHESFYELLVEE